MKKYILIAFFLTLAISASVMAIVDSSTFTNVSFGYDLYEIGMNKTLKGPLGFISGAAAIAMGAVACIRGQVMISVPCVIGGAALLNAEKIINSLGVIV